MTPLFWQHNLKVMRHFVCFPLLLDLFFSPFLLLPPQFQHACRSACWKHLSEYIYLECEQVIFQYTALGVKYSVCVCTHMCIYIDECIPAYMYIGHNKM